MCNEVQLEEISRQMAQSYREVFGKDLVSTLLYGSYARGDYDEESDVDYVAIVRGPRLELQNKVKQVWPTADRLSMEHDILVSPMVIPYDEYQEYGDTLVYYRNIKKEGKQIG